MITARLVVYPYSRSFAMLYPSRSLSLPICFVLRLVRLSPFLNSQATSTARSPSLPLNTGYTPHNFQRRPEDFGIQQVVPTSHEWHGIWGARNFKSGYVTAVGMRRAFGILLSPWMKVTKWWYSKILASLISIEATLRWMSTLDIVLVVAVYIEQEVVAESNDICGRNSLKSQS